MIRASPVTRAANNPCSRRGFASPFVADRVLPTLTTRSSAETVMTGLGIELLRQRHHRRTLRKLRRADQLGIRKDLRIRIGALCDTRDNRWHPCVGVNQLGFHREKMLDEQAAR